MILVRSITGGSPLLVGPGPKVGRGLLLEVLACDVVALELPLL